MTSTTPKSISRTRSTSKAVVAIIVATMGLAAITPAANAAGPDRDGRHGRELQASRQGGPQFGHGAQRGGPRGGQFLAIGCGPNAAERIETSLVRLGYHVDATAEQKALLDALKTSALDAQADLAAVCAELMPAPAAAAEAPAPDAAPAAAPNLLTRLQSGLKVQEARVAAMSAVLPQFEAFYNSLSDEQKAKLEPRGREGRGPGHERGHEPRPHRN